MISFSKAKKVYNLDKRIYLVKARVSSTSFSNFFKPTLKRLDILKITDLIVNDMKKIKKFKEYEDVILKQLFKEYSIKFIGVILTNKLTLHDKKVVINGYLNYLDIYIPKWENSLSKNELEFGFGVGPLKKAFTKRYFDKSYRTEKDIEIVKQKMLETLKKAI